MITFKVKELQNLEANLIEFEIEGGITTPEEAFQVELPKVPLNKGLILSGRGPIWLYGRLIHHYHPSRWIGVFDPRLNGAVVVASHWPAVKPGQVIKLTENGPKG
ncbi:CRISPR-associated ring nuclease Crn3/Csx3 [Thermovibrio sp.]